MNKTETLMSVAIALVAVFVGSSPALAHGKGLYSTEAEAQARADEIGCITVHQNNGKWMPCADERELHQQLRKQ
ncbi:DUF3721 domain-containing protein [Synechococcus sp. PROS-9-1]|uniref:DUF3721 domain-containing protein n=1 Tax=Synechococcus sp. PROS-9-1 TaxID=1968775 RepID=UPI0016486523|nr:DUF3721 domain-containing protein [Synechococcus sp. PROS-9-1]